MYAVFMLFVQRDLATELKKYMRNAGLGQSDLAVKIDVSQATISRALTRAYSRKSLARKKIERFLDKNASKVHKSSVIPEDLKLAVQEVWDKTSNHAEMLAKVIRATQGLGPVINAKKNG
jgi:predicted transcriptional regulator